MIFGLLFQFLLHNERERAEGGCPGGQDKLDTGQTSAPPACQQKQDMLVSIRLQRYTLSGHPKTADAQVQCLTMMGAKEAADGGFQNSSSSISETHVCPGPTHALHTHIYKLASSVLSSCLPRQVK